MAAEGHHLIKLFSILEFLSICRYFSDSTAATDFAVDDSQSTVWSSMIGDSPVTFVLGLSQPVMLSKIFITFEGAVPSFLNATLQFLNVSTSEWVDLQYYAVSCGDSFDMAEDAP